MFLSSILSDGMVLQRDKTVKLWGKTSGSQEVKLSFLGELYETTSDKAGNWEITLEGLKPGGPYDMEIEADEKVIIKDILVGDVWILSGQSNMEIPVYRTKDLLGEELKAVNYPFIRKFAVPQEFNFEGPQQDITGGEWLSANEEDVMNFSAAGFFFAKRLYDTYQIPIGLIHTAVGGTPIEAWMKEETLRQVGGYDQLIDQSKDKVYVETTIQEDEEREQKWHQQLNENDKGFIQSWYKQSVDMSDWNTFHIPNTWEGTELEDVRGAVWFRKEIDIPAAFADTEAKLAFGTIIDADAIYVNGTKVGETAYMYPPRRYTIPKGLLKPGKNTIAIRVISYQNTGGFITEMPYHLTTNNKKINLEGNWNYKIGVKMEGLQPKKFFRNNPTGLYNGMIAPLKNCSIQGVLWYQGESNTHFPEGYSDLFEKLVADWRATFNHDNFPFIFTQLANFGERNNKKATNWAELREEQRQSLKVPNTAMAVAIDIGEHNDIHPQDKKTLGERLALCAKSLAYGEDVVYSGPIVNKVERSGDAIHVYFDHIGSGLTVKGDKLNHFMVAEQDGRFVDANAIIEGNKIVVTSETVKEPTQVRYAWMDNPDGANLYNKEGLPATSFQASVNNNK